MRNWISSFVIGAVAAIATPNMVAAEEKASLNSMALAITDTGLPAALPGQPLNQPFRVVSSDGVKWDEVVSGKFTGNATMNIDTKWPGYIEELKIVLGTCSPGSCHAYPLLHQSGSIIKRDFSGSKIVAFSSDELPKPASTQPANFAKDMIAKCNEKLSANGPTEQHSFDFTMRATLVAQTGLWWGALGPNTDAVGPFSGAAFEEHHARTDSFTVKVECEPVSLATEDPLQPVPELEVSDIKLFLSTYSNANSQTNLGTTCKKGQVKVRLSASKQGAVNFKLWTRVGASAITSKVVTSWASPDGNGGFQAEHVEWLSVNKPTVIQAKARELATEGSFKKETSWKSLQLQCEDASGGGIAPDMSDYKTTANLSVNGTAGHKCPRLGQVGFKFISNYSFLIKYRLTCINGIDQSGTVSLSKSGSDWVGQSKVLFQIKKTGGVGCAIRQIRHGKAKVLALATNDFVCNKRVIDGGPNTYVPDSNQPTHPTRPTRPIHPVSVYNPPKCKAHWRNVCKREPVRTCRKIHGTSCKRVPKVDCRSVPGRTCTRRPQVSCTNKVTRTCKRIAKRVCRLVGATSIRAKSGSRGPSRPKRICTTVWTTKCIPKVQQVCKRKMVSTCRKTTKRVCKRTFARRCNHTVSTKCDTTWRNKCVRKRKLVCRK